MRPGGIVYSFLNLNEKQYPSLNNIGWPVPPCRRGGGERTEESGVIVAMMARSQGLLKSKCHEGEAASFFCATSPLRRVVI